MAMSDQIPRRTFPCNECPVRCDNADNPRAKFPAERWESLEATIEQTPYLDTQPLFGCHKGTPGDPDEDLICAGWLASFGWESIRIRLAVHYGRLDPAALTPGEGWPELYGDWDEMAEAQLWLPGNPDEHLPIGLCAARKDDGR
jgi:hypothetical protein